MVYVITDEKPFMRMAVIELLSELRPGHMARVRTGAGTFAVDPARIAEEKDPVTRARPAFPQVQVRSFIVNVDGADFGAINAAFLTTWSSFTTAEKYGFPPYPVVAFHAFRIKSGEFLGTCDCFDEAVSVLTRRAVELRVPPPWDN